MIKSYVAEFRCECGRRLFYSEKSPRIQFCLNKQCRNFNIKLMAPEVDMEIIEVDMERITASIVHEGIRFDFTETEGFAIIGDSLSGHDERQPKMSVTLPRFKHGCNGNIKSEDGILKWQDQSGEWWKWDGSTREESLTLDQTPA